jgi:hypothetical protein
MQYGLCLTTFCSSSWVFASYGTHQKSSLFALGGTKMADTNCANHSGHTAQIESLSNGQIEINASLREIVKGQHELRERVAMVDSSSKSAHHRLDTIEDLTKSIHEMSYAVKGMASQVADLLVLIKEHDGRIEKIEHTPGMIAIKGWWFVGGIVGTAILAFVLGKFGL